MKTKGKRKPSQIVLWEGKPRAVTLDIEEYEEVLERLEDLENLKMLEHVRRESISFKSLDKFLKEYSPVV
jgi:PHD/YefM family antitoxin component YafN of YafNO toxin-antitoxin module